jgi:hypothetical protein
VNKHLRYASYLLRHKWHVFIASCRLGIPWRGLTHDLSKFRPDEWVPYADYFYGGPYPESGAEAQAQHTKTKGAVQRDFDRAWLLHQKRNDHHWQWYVLHEDSGATKVLLMPEHARRELLADWRGAGIAITGKDNTAEWFKKNRQHMILHPQTVMWLCLQLGIAVPWRDDIRVPRPDGSGVQFEWVEGMGAA